MENHYNIYILYKEVINITVSKAQQKATEKYKKENYDRVLVQLPKGTKERFKVTGKSVNGFINESVMEKLEQLKK